MGKDTKRLVRASLREAAIPVRDEASRMLTSYGHSSAARFHVSGERMDKSAAKYGISVRRTGIVSVEQRLRKSGNESRRRAKFGGLQMRKSLIPALEAKSDVVEKKVAEAVSLACAKFNLGG